jgi:hypothetical protein
VSSWAEPAGRSVRKPDRFDARPLVKTIWRESREFGGAGALRATVGFCEGDADPAAAARLSRIFVFAAMAPASTVAPAVPDERPRAVSRVSASYWTQTDEVAKITKGSVSNSLKLQRDGGRDRDRTADPLLAKQALSG